MIDPGKAVKKSNVAEVPAIPPTAKILFALVFGLAFGFLLQKGGVGKFHILIGQLLLQDFTVAKVMLTAIVVGMAGIFALHWRAKVNLNIKPTHVASNIIGGLVFGVGFALLGYCPGTAATALGQGNWDALFGMAGLILGSYLYAEFSAAIEATIDKWGAKGKLMLPDVLHIPRGVFVPIFAALLIGVLFLLARFTTR